MSALVKFVDARLADDDLPSPVRQAFGRITGIARQLRGAGQDDDWLSWLTGTDPTLKIGEYVLGADPATKAAEFADQLMATLAATWQNHPDYQPEWDKKLPPK